MLLWYIFLAVAVILLQRTAYRIRGMKGVQYTRSFSVGVCTEGDTVQMIEVVSNRGWMPLPWLRLESLIPGDFKFQKQFNLNVSEGEIYQNHSSFFSLMPYTRIVRRHQVVCRKRGVYRLETVTMTCGDLFGLHRMTQKIGIGAELLVYPGFVDSDDMPLSSRSWQGDVTVRRWIVEDPFMIAGAREYRYGDSLKSVNWKATARTGELRVHRRDFTADLKIIVCVNFSVSESMWKAVTDPELVERELRLAATFARRLIAQGLAVGFACNGRLIDGPRHEAVRVEPESGEGQLASLLETMARLVIEWSVPFETVLERPAREYGEHTGYLLITPYVNEAIRDGIARLQADGHAVDVLLTEAEPEAEGGPEAQAGSEAGTGSEAKAEQEAKEGERHAPPVA